MRRYTVQDLFSFRAALRDGPYGGCFFPYSPLFRRSQVSLKETSLPYGTSPIRGGFRLSS